MGKGGRSLAASKGQQSKSKSEPEGIKHVTLIESMAEAELREHAVSRGLPGASSATREELLLALAPYAKGITHPFPAPKCLPLAKPTVTFTEVRAALPKKLFKRSLTAGLFHVAFDVAMVLATFYASTFIPHPAVPAMLRPLLWAAYWFVQGTTMTGIWVLAHECGHHAFSDSELANNIVGWVLHSLLLVPYHSWRVTHGKHHNNTGSCENDEVFVPSTRSKFGEELVEDTPLGNLFGIIFMLTVGWMPGYLVFNATGPSKYEGKANHFDPWAPFFDAKDRVGVIISDVGFLGAVAALYWAVKAFGGLAVWCYFGIPYMVVNLYLVLITFLQHTDVFLPHFRGEEWSWFRGALCTVDRSFGPLIDHTIHHIADTHVAHHLFSKMPFYHAQEATVVLSETLGDYYMLDSTPVPKALWRAYSCCDYVDNDGNTVFFKQK
jgi:omega-6 fatty acid desaturase (delta-12 desaturase)